MVHTGMVWYIRRPTSLDIDVAKLKILGTLTIYGTTVHNILFYDLLFTLF